MPRQAEPYTLIKCPRTKYWYYKLPSWPSHKSTGRKTKTRVMQVVREAISNNTTIETLNKGAYTFTIISSRKPDNLFKAFKDSV